ncbi:NAD(P)-binding domain-containing protein [Kaistella jeonii]|uniref:NAD(P)-binding domain-containing protein n=1 Tax=Kaistella jeonii TaxID=266749 RepID=UPI000689CA07|nr:NAD(P)-binding domain-containing protein [Kaistella jeonii]SFC20643.1 Nucleoside-diphosphate-sugar epimerase [Kaistella jeonii]VEI96980.1 prephenate dehydrogenase [Kaistella jeonii]
MRIAIIGCGWVGKRLAKYLTEKNYEVIATTTSEEKIASLKDVASEVHVLDFNTTENFDFLNDVDVAIFSMPISRDGWLEGFKNLEIKFPKTILFSSTGIYPTENRTFTEKDTDHLRSDILTAENLVREKFPQTTILRFGGLMGDERALSKMFKNRIPENPQKKANYIHYEDILAVVELVINSEIKSEIYNIVAPEHPSIAEILNIKTGENTDLSTENKQRIISSAHFVQDFNYTFIHPNPKYF